jgi:predicted DNA binding CopG/RHH family protein
MKKKPIPKFRTEARERAFWAAHDSKEFLNWKQSERQVFPRLTPSLKTISLRLPELLLEELKLLANKRDVPYQSLLKLYLAERVEEELQLVRARGSKPKRTNAP